MATRAKVRIVPVTIDGSYKIMEKGSLIVHPQNVKLTIHPIFDASNYEDKQTQQMAEDLQKIIDSAP